MNLKKKIKDLEFNFDASKLENLIEVCLDQRVDLVVFAGGFPKKRQIEKKIKEFMINTMCFATTSSIAKKMIDNGIDGLILRGMRQEVTLDQFQLIF